MKPKDTLAKSYLSYPKTRLRVSRLTKSLHIFIGFILFPIYWIAAYFVGTPGLRFRGECAAIGVRILVKKQDFTRAYKLIVKPMDSFRYFEFDFMWRAVKDMKINSYLDISSPRLLPLMLINKNSKLKADLINPDKKDMPITKSLAEFLGITKRCRFHPDLIEEVALEPCSFDLVTSISVIEHIPDDIKAIRTMWSLLRPGGRLLISVPCAAIAKEEYINRNDYKLIDQDENGFVFWQRYYSEELLRQHIFEITGDPHRFLIYAEKEADNYEKNVLMKRTNPLYPYWQEPFMMGVQYEYKAKLSELPGMGVIAMEFVKQE